MLQLKCYNEIYCLIAVEFPPMFTVGKDEFGNAKMTGIAGDVLEIMVDHFNVTMNYVIANPSNIVKYGIESALYRLLDRDVIWSLLLFPDHDPNLFTNYFRSISFRIGFKPLWKPWTIWSQSIRFGSFISRYFSPGRTKRVGLTRP